MFCAREESAICSSASTCLLIPCSSTCSCRHARAVCGDGGHLLSTQVKDELGGLWTSGVKDESWAGAEVSCSLSRVFTAVLRKRGVDFASCLMACPVC